MKNYEMKKLLERALGIEVHEEIAAWILAGVEDALRNEACPPAQHSIYFDEHRFTFCPDCGELLSCHETPNKAM